MSRQTKSVLMRSNERERLRVAATVTQEREWPQNEPNQGLARMFVVMLLIHVVVIGGVIIYDFVGQPEDAKPVATNSKSVPKTAAPAPTPAPNTVASEPKTPVQEVPVLTSNITTATEGVPVAVPVPNPPAAAQTPVNNGSLLTQSMLTAAPTTIVDLPSEGTVTAEAKPMTAPLAPKPEVAAPEKPKPTPAKAEPAKVEKAVALGSTPKPVMTPSDARKALQNDAKRTTTVAQKKSEAAKAAPTKKVSTPSRHTVSKGDTIYGIARRYKVSEKSLMQANGIKNANALRVGKALSIPR
jgi:membrane-bound lytic murein transglycosylase D